MVVVFAQRAGQQAKQEEAAKEKYYLEHPKTAAQVRADGHFNTCWQYRNTPTSVWSDNQKEMMLGMEGCYEDDRDDPFYRDATYPWNANAPQPWKAQEH